MLLLLLLAGCAHRVELTSSPPGAMVTWRGRRVGPTPVVLKVRPFQTGVVTARLGGYRPYEAELGPPKLLRRGSRIELLLVEEHGAAGTWTPDEAP